MPRFNSLPNNYDPIFLEFLVAEMVSIRDILEGFLARYRTTDGCDGVCLDRTYSVPGQDIQDLVCAADRLGEALKPVEAIVPEPWWVVLGLERGTPWTEVQEKYRSLKDKCNQINLAARIDAAYAEARGDRFK